MPPVGFEPTISVGERPQTYALDRAATGTGISGKIIKEMPDSVASEAPCISRKRQFLLAKLHGAGHITEKIIIHSYCHDNRKCQLSTQ